MAEEEKQEEEVSSGGSKKKLILLVVGAVILMGGGIAGGIMLAGGGSDDEEVLEEEVIVKGDPVYVDLKPPFTVNLDPEDSVGFLQISMQVLTHDDDVADDLSKHKPLIRNNLVTLFSQQKSVDLRTSSGKQDLQQSARDLVQTIVNDHGSGGEVEDVFFTTFVMQ